MNNKIPFHQLASKMAERAGLSVPGAESVIKAFFAVVEEGLAEKESVKIKGLGTFCLSGNPDSPVAFEPDKEVADAVNAPFAMFVTEEINPGVSESMLEGVEEAEETKEAKVANLAKVATPEPEIPEPEIPEIPAVPPMPTPPPPPPVVKVEPEKVEPEKVERPEPVEVEPIVPPIIPQAPTEEVEEEEEVAEEAEEETEEVQQSSTFWPGFIIGLVTGLAIGALAVFIYMSENLSSDQPVANPAELVSTK